ncbi:MAG: branched-chain amino acid aminotransferase [Firmicutes bacterium]|nr:branched-chain amino acid aminotransferase [Bacillota bacterium]
MQLQIIKAEENNRRPKPPSETEIEFGKYFADHVFHMTYEAGRGWNSPVIEPYKTFQVDPACLTLHYGQQIFEGMKAYVGVDGNTYLFRPLDHLNRLNKSAYRLCMPEINVDEVLEALIELLKLDNEWIPTSKGSSLYIRPFMIATEASLGVKVSSKYLFCIMTGPAGAYYAEGFNPVKIYVTDQYSRVARGGTGTAKTSGNYAASLLASEEAKAKGFTQVLWLDPVEHKYVEEVGTMNIFFRIGNKLVTPELNGSILPGITRDSVIKIAKHWNMDVEERPISIDEVIQEIQNGNLTEIFGTGTAAIISPVGELHYKGTTYKIADGQTGELAKKLFETILGIQYGELDDVFGWRLRI